MEPATVTSARCFIDVRPRRRAADDGQRRQGGRVLQQAGAVRARVLGGEDFGKWRPRFPPQLESEWRPHRADCAFGGRARLQKLIQA